MMARRSNKASSREKVKKTATKHVGHRRVAVTQRAQGQLEGLSSGERAKLAQIGKNRRAKTHRLTW